MRSIQRCQSLYIFAFELALPQEGCESDCKLRVGRGYLVKMIKTTAIRCLLEVYDECMILVRRFSTCSLQSNLSSKE